MNVNNMSSSPTSVSTPSKDPVEKIAKNSSPDDVSVDSQYDEPVPEEPPTTYVDVPTNANRSAASTTDEVQHANFDE